MNDAEYKRIIRLAFDNASEGYDHPAMRFFDNSAAHLASLLPLKGGEHLLDLATGTGKVALSAAGRLPKGKVTGIDLSEGMLSKARQRAQALGLRHVLFRQGDVSRLDFKPGTFDGATCAFGVHFWQDMETPLKGLLPLLKSGGFIAIASFAKGSFEPMSELTLKRFKAYGIKMPENYTWERLDSAEKNRALLERAGFKHVKISRAAMGHKLDDVMAWWHLVCYTGFRSFLSHLSPERAERYKAEHLEEIQKFAGADGSIPLGIDVIFSIAEKP